MSEKAINEGAELPDGLVGVLFNDDRGFVCTEHLEDDEDIDDEEKCTPIFDCDEWFNGDRCVRGDHHVRGGKQ